MSKKKVSGNTMTLKDFHGGSIPTDLILPSAPGVTARATDCSGGDRHTSWVNPIGRFDNRSRPHSSPATRNFDDKSPFISQTAQIGRNFDEDERRPLDGISGPRRTISDDRIRLSSGHIELKPEYNPGRILSVCQSNAPVSQSPGAGVNLYSGRVAEVFLGGENSQYLVGKKEQGVDSGHPNSWVTNKEITKVAEPDQSVWSRGTSAVLKLAHASAVEKVSSGRWQSKTVHYQTDVDNVRSSERRSDSHSNHSWNNAYNKMDASSLEKEHRDAMRARHVEKGLYVNDQSEDSRIINKERSGAYRHSDVRYKSTSYYANEGKPAWLDGNISGSEMQHSVTSELSERPKLKLLPRTKPLETSEPTVANYMQGYQSAKEQVHIARRNEVYGNLISANPDLGNNEGVKHVPYQPKLNLKPHSQPSEQWEDNIEMARNPLFCGARPRELVLKERGVDDVASNHRYDSVDLSNRVEQNVVKYGKFDHASPRRNGDRTGHAPFDQRIGMKTDRKEPGVDAERGNVQRRNWCGDNRRNNREAERQQPTERQPSPYTWRKPVEESKQSSPAAIGLRYGKAVSALDLAQAFSRSVSEPKRGDNFPGQRGLAGRPQVPFSRLVASTPRPQINGY